MPADPKPAKRLKDPELFKRLHLRGGECCLCGTTRHLQLHHKQRRSQGGSDTEANLVFLCPDCHTRLHDGNLTLRERNIVSRSRV